MRVVTRSLDLAAMCQKIVKQMEVNNTHEAIRAPRARPRPAGSGLRPCRLSFGAPGPLGCARALDTASLSLRLKTSIYEPSCVTVAEVTRADGGTGDGDGFLKVESESLDSGRAALSAGTAVSGTGDMTGDDGRLVGRKKEGALSAPYIVLAVCFKY